MRTIVALLHGAAREDQFTTTDGKVGAAQCRDARSHHCFAIIARITRKISKLLDWFEVGQYNISVRAVVDRRKCS
jgi:hypothetical protein